MDEASELLARLNAEASTIKGLKFEGFVAFGVQGFRGSEFRVKDLKVVVSGLRLWGFEV